MPPPHGPPPIALAHAPMVFPFERGRPNNSDNHITFQWVRFRATAEFRVTPGQQSIDDWSVGFVQRVLLVHSFHCYRRLSGPAIEPGSYPLEDGPVLVVRKTLPRNGRYPFDGQEWRPMYFARPPIVSSGVSFPVTATMIDTPGVRHRPAFLTRTLPAGVSGDVCIHSSSVSAQFYVTVAARHDPSGLIYPFWHLRWDLRARYFHVRQFHTQFESHRDDTCYHHAVVSSAQNSHDMGAHGYVDGPRRGETPANDAQSESEEWVRSCPDP